MKPHERIRLMLVDDHFVVRAGLAGALTLEKGLQIAVECDTGEEAVVAYREHRPDVVIMDWRLPGMNGVETTREIRREFPEARIIILTVYEGEEDIHRAVQAGVAGYLPKTVRRRELISAIRAAHGGESCFPPSIAQKLEAHRTRPTLTDRELQVLQCIVRGRSNKEISCDLEMAEATVKFHIGKILEKLGAADRTQAATVAFQRGILHVS